MKYIVVATGLAIIAFFPIVGAVQENAPAQDVALVGPIPIGELFRLMANKETQAERMEFGEWPEESHVIKALNKAKLWIKDKRKPNGKNVELVFQDNPSLLIEGKLSFDLKDRKGNPFVIGIKEIELLSTGFGKDTREISVLVRLSTSKYRTIASSDSGLNFIFDGIVWGRAGNVAWSANK